MVKCSRCGVEIDDSFELCPNCGNELNEETPKNDSEAEISGSVEVSKTCPKCGHKLENDSEFCSECGQSLHPIKKSNNEDILSNIDFVKVGTFSLIATIVSAILSVIFLAIMNLSNYNLFNIPFFPLAFYLAIFVSVAFFAALQKNYFEGVLLALIVGILMAILEGSLVSLVLSAYGYWMYFGYHSVEFIILSVIIGFASNYLLKDYLSTYIKIDHLF
ncbi:MAG: zinc ribbon domain-containing protein [Methanobrevibacter sp.]|uniref:zinc ribbon domain-containing protein n=1 Tax=Methanobrevibacter sp. TaxID=66852 RepID=UPI0025F2066F|nr:zinc ribbon domain-containing protein [Methanobrevibacter sp.]MBR6993103.1 zinc ribbon domain-containing protein [Methanobrevibacter sp.]